MPGPLKAGDRLAKENKARRNTGMPPQPRNCARKPRPGIGRIAGGVLARGIYRLALLGVVGALVVGGGLFLYFSSGLPSVAKLRHYEPPLETRIYAGDFRLIAALGTQHRIYVPYDRIPPVVARAFISAEDRNFWTEPGIDPLAIVRAGLVDLTRLGSGERPLGASTITMQVVKNMLLDNRINFTRKIKEAILALRVNRALSKQRILTLYLNEIYLGQNSWGVAAAAEAYFDKPLSSLTVAEAAMLGGLPKAPTNYNPFIHPKRALHRRNWVIRRMRDDGAITEAEAKQALAAPLLPKAAAGARPVPGAGYFVNAVESQLVQMFGRKTTMEGGLIVRTSLDPSLQAAAMDAMRDRLESYDHEFGVYHGPVAKLDVADLATGWPKALAKQATPPGLRRRWRLGVVIDETPSLAHIGWLQGDNSGTTDTGTLSLAAIQWGRPMINGTPGPLLRSMSQMLKPGDVIMIDPHKKTKGGTVALEQIPHVEGSMLSLDPETGRVRVMVGGWSNRMSPYNRAIQAQRQPGSSVKPFDYLTAMQAGIQPDATILDAPFTQRMADGQLYRPGDYETNFLGPVPVFYAIEQSLNLATLHLVRRVGLANVAANFEKFRIVHHMPLIYPAAIGALDTTLWRMVRGYAALDEYGRQVDPSLIDSVTAPDGHVLYQAPDQSCANCMDGSADQPPVLNRPGAQLADPASIYQVIMMMRNVTEYGTGVPAVAGIHRPVAGKTGTTNNFNDAWFIGFVPQMVTGCWIGYDTPRNLGKNQTGGNVCGPAWNQFMKIALKGQPVIDFKTPQGMTLHQVSFGNQTVAEAFKPGQVPGAQSNLGLVADNPLGLGGSLSNSTGQGGQQDFNPASSTSGNGGNPQGSAPQPPPAQSVDKTLGGLY
ncbi:PBP1A family penicillin-binding protein [Acidiphilium sp. AL]|uniref:Penicillin-binding protein 1A n=1 Tax=Acidiphilium iwatense TaxID=768198 RepID=A0ABS9DS41_9PROT|nr:MULTISPECIES: PBP1A family penicillin-binding protein [Acidiphilium]MCF3945559.1 PBP1A family penicillin-binding protein [Acidiphilium iwatense]MCU4159636.1 PBP1A family penicillin-binding protein [Acidiphilium sp. AL]